MALAALRLAPAFTASGLVGRVEALGDDALQLHAAGGQQDRVAGGDEVVDVADVGRRVLDIALQPRLALCQRQRPQVLLTVEHLVEDEEHEVLGLGVGDRRLQGRKVRRAGVVQRHHLAVDDPVAQLGAGGDDLGNFEDQSSPCG